ncbi:MAG: NAD(P)-dependent oxidoreductase [Burkholderiales bacterium]|nr:NAD(P)-dependent oxidoreductase [Burkholderiales bacterium]
MLTLVTGATGFVGTNVVEALLERGDEVIAFGQGEMTVAARGAFARFGKQLRRVDGDVRDAACVDALFAGARIDRLVHAAVITAGVEREKRDVTPIVEVNVAGSARVLEAARRNAVGRIVHVSSGAAYGRSLFEYDRLYEDLTPERPQTMYQITKFAGERSALRLRDLHGLDLVCVRLGSVIGPWERDTGVRDTLSTHFQLARLAAQGGTALLPQREYRRDWVYSRDVAAGIVAVLEANSPSHGLYNLSANREWGGLAPWCEALRSIHGAFSYRVAREGERTNLNISELQDRGRMDIGRMVQDIGFEPRFGPREAYEDYTRWLRQYGDGMRA